jgi:hypothetical protein
MDMGDMGMGDMGMGDMGDMMDMDMDGMYDEF